MPEIAINVREKIAQVSGSPEIVCGNSDYAVVFDMDSEWDTYEFKTIHIVWLDIRTGKKRYAEVTFSGSTCVLPAIYDAYEIAVGIYAGDIRTTTPARIPCARCITDGGSAHEPPPPDVYSQILDLLEKIAKPVGFGATGDATMMLDGAGIGIVGIAEYDADIVDLLEEPYLSTVQNGSLADNTGQPTSRTDRATCYSYIDIPDERYRFKVDIAISGTAGKYFVDLYDENENYLYSATSSTDPLTGVAYYSFTDSGTFRSVHSDAKKIRVGVRNASNSNFSASSITEFKITFM